MANIYEVPTNELIEKTAQELKKIEHIVPPEWANYVKTGTNRERPPVKKNWWYVRAASILRKTYKLGPIGVSKLRTYYGGKKNRGMKPEKFFKGSGNILRKILQQLEKSELVKQEKVGNHKGRVITPKGKSLLDKIATQILSTKPKIKKHEKVLKVEVKKQAKKEKKKEEAPKEEIKEEKKEEIKKVEEKKPEVKKEAPNPVKKEKPKAVKKAAPKKEKK